MKWLFFLMSVTAAGPAVSGNLPQYEPEDWCRAVASSGGSYSQVIMNGCIAQEQQAYDALQSAWGDETGATQSWCDQVAQSGGQGSYVILLGCLVQENHAARSPQKFRR